MHAADGAVRFESKVVMSPAVNYDDLAATYNRRYRHTRYDGVRDVLREFMSGPVTAAVLEIGSGTGHWLTVLQEHGVRAVGIDRSSLMLRQVGKGGHRLCQGAAEWLPCRAGTFDRVYCVNAFHHFEDRDAAVGEIRRTLSKGGGVCIVGLDPHGGVDQWCIYEYFDGVHQQDLARYASASAIRTLLESHGFSACRTVEAQHVVLHLEAREALATGRLDKSVTSQLALLREDEYQYGLARIHDGIREAADRGEELYLTTDLRLYATTGWIAS